MKISIVALTSLAVAFALCPSAQARHRSRPHLQANTTDQPDAGKPANVPEKNRDPQDLALDRKIKGICRGC